MREKIKKLFINGMNIHFQECHAEQRGGQIVLYTMGSPRSGDKLLKAGDRLPFEGYMVYPNRMMVPIDIDLNEKQPVKIVFEYGEVFEGIAGFIVTKTGCTFGIRTVYEDVMIVIDILKEKDWCLEKYL